MSNPFSPIPLFATPFFTARISEAAQHQAALVAHIEALAETDPGVKRSNRDGWHSSPGFLDADHPSVAWLRERVVSFSRGCVGRRFRSPEDLVLIQSWATILQPTGGWHSPHHHRPAEWSGVFYVRAGPQPDAETRTGMLEFVHPSPVRGEGNFAMAPQDGTLVLFPAHLVHFVYPHVGESTRIAVAFNLAER